MKKGVHKIIVIMEMAVALYLCERGAVSGGS